MVYWQLGSCSLHSPCTPQQQHPTDKRNKLFFKFAFPWGNHAMHSFRSFQSVITKLEQAEEPACLEALQSLQGLPNFEQTKMFFTCSSPTSAKHFSFSSQWHKKLWQQQPLQAWQGASTPQLSLRATDKSCKGIFGCVLMWFFWVIRGTQRRQLMCFVFCSNHTNLERNQLINPVYLRSSPAAAPTCSIPQAQLWYQLPGTGTVCCSMFSLTQHGLSPPRGFQQYK